LYHCWKTAPSGKLTLSGTSSNKPSPRLGQLIPRAGRVLLSEQTSDEEVTTKHEADTKSIALKSLRCSFEKEFLAWPVSTRNPFQRDHTERTGNLEEDVRSTKSWSESMAKWGCIRSLERSVRKTRWTYCLHKTFGNLKGGQALVEKIYWIYQ